MAIVITSLLDMVEGLLERLPNGYFQQSDHILYKIHQPTKKFL